jgi:hypothetical protein
MTNRRARHGNRDARDMARGVGVCNEVRAANRIELGKWMKEAETKKTNAGAAVAACWIKRSQKSSPADAYVVKSGAQCGALLREAE